MESGLQYGEGWRAWASGPYQGRIFHSCDFYETYTEVSIDSQFMFGQMGGFFPDVFRGGLPGEVYITSGFPDGSFKVSFSADTGKHFRVVHQRQGFAAFMSDRKAGDFYIVTQQKIETQQPWGWYYQVCIEHYTDYGETLTGIYCHELQRHYPSVNCLGIMDLQAEVQNSNVALQWNLPQAEQPVAAYLVYRDNLLLAELQQTDYLDEDLPNGRYTYYVKALYVDDCETLSYNVVKVAVEFTGIEKNDLSDIRVYPNPTTGQLRITNHESRIMNVEVFDLMGRQFVSNLKSQTSNLLMDLSNLPTGIYFIRIQTENNVITRKIIKN
jgi:hypothetical protein